MQRNSCVFFKSWYDHIVLQSKGVQYDALRAILDYAFTGEVRVQIGLKASEVFAAAKAQIDFNNKQYLNGLRGGAPKGSMNNPNGRRGGSAAVCDGGTNPELTQNKPRTNPELTQNKPRTNPNLYLQTTETQCVMPYDGKNNPVAPPIKDKEKENVPHTPYKEKEIEKKKT